MTALAILGGVTAVVLVFVAVFLMLLGLATIIFH